MRSLLLSGLATLALSQPAQAAFISEAASLYAPLMPVGTATTIVGVQDIETPSQRTVRRAGYTIAFDVASDQGVVRGAIPSTIHATPVAGVTAGGAPEYLSGDFGSALTRSATAGNYLSTGLGTITITFATPETSLALLWGSIDASNRITFNDAGHDTLTGAAVQRLATGFRANGFQGPAGSAYVSVLTDTPFTTVTLSSGVISFEAAGIAASTAPFPTPEPVSIAVLGAGLLGLRLVRRRG